MYSMTWKAIACIYQYAFVIVPLFPLLKAYKRPKVTMVYTVLKWKWMGWDVVSQTWQDRGHLGRIRTPPGRILSSAWGIGIPRAKEQKSMTRWWLGYAGYCLLPRIARFSGGDTSAEYA
jgi:hypothetical protein